MSDSAGADETQRVELTRESVELYKILKFEGLVDSGAQAKQVIAAGMVRVNGLVETRKRKKVVDGDRIQFEGLSLIACVGETAKGSSQ